MSATETTKFTINLTDDQVKKIKKLADSQGITATEALLKAIETESYIQGKIVRGSKILVQNQGNEINQLIFD